MDVQLVEPGPEINQNQRQTKTVETIEQEAKGGDQFDVDVVRQASIDLRESQRKNIASPARRKRSQSDVTGPTQAKANTATEPALGCNQGMYGTAG